MQSIKDLINNKDEKYIKSMVDRHKYVTTEYQDYGYRIALQLGQTDKISLYIKIAKEKPRALVEQAFSFAIDYPNAKNKGRLFMWKLKELEKESDERNGNVDKKSDKKVDKKGEMKVSKKVVKKAEKKRKETHSVEKVKSTTEKQTSQKQKKADLTDKEINKTKSKGKIVTKSSKNAK